MDPSLQQTTVVQYTGNSLASGQLHGHGRAEFSSGQVYEGDWRHGHMDGMGKLIFPDGVCYQGSLVSDRISGSGVYQWGTTVYEGEVMNGLRHGHGTLTFTDSPVVYEGDWRHGKRHGTGVIYYDADRTSYYKGEWQDDMKHGQGTSVYPSGNSYSGSWAYDKREGPGTMAWNSKGQVYSGMWADNLPNGLGEHVWQQGMPALQVANHAMHFMFNRYFGAFKDGKRHGEGALWYSSGARYEGQWDNDRKQGSGVYMFEDGIVFAGEFAADRPVLQSGSMFSAAGTFTSATTADTSTGSAAANSPANAIGGAPATDAASVTGDKIMSMAASAADHAAPIKQEASVAGAGSTVADAPAPGAAAAIAANGSSSGPGMVEGPPGFGPRISSPQLYIADVLQECDAPAATYKAVVNLLTGCNTELRALYDRYCNRLSPLLDPTAQRNSWALQAGQVWELLKDSQLLCRHMQLQHVCKLLQQTLEPPQPVLERRQQVFSTADAVAVLMPLQQPYNPTVELLFRDFCELLVRISAMRYPQLPCLEQQLQQVLMQHLLPLLGSTSRQGGGRQSMQPRASLMQVSSGIDNSSISVAVPAFVGMSGPEQFMQQDDVVVYLQSQARGLQQLFAVFAGLGCGYRAATSATAAPTAEQQEALQQQDAQELDQRLAETAWIDQAVSVRQVLNVLQQAGVLQQWQMNAYAAAAVLLEGALSVSDPEGLRARLDDTNLEPPDSLDAQQQASEQAAGAAMRQGLLFWMDAPLLHAEVVWGLVRCAATMQLQQLQQLQVQQGQQQPAGEVQEQQQSATAYTGRGQAPTNLAVGGKPIDLAARVQALLEGHGGLFQAVLGVRAAVAEDLQRQPVEEQADQDNAEQLEQQQGREDAAAAEDGEQGLDGASTVDYPADAYASRPDTAATDSSPMGQGGPSPQQAGSSDVSPRAAASQQGTPRNMAS